jgi:dienelactone hydrolase
MTKAIFKFFVLFIFSFQSFATEPLKFSSSPKKYSGATTINNQVFLPDEKSSNVGRAIILVPACSGIRSVSIAGYKEWIKFFTSEGYTVLMVDHYGQRNVPDLNGCGDNRKRILLPNPDLANDILDATEHLSKIPGVDKNKIFSLGFSLGTMANGIVASKSWNGLMFNRERLKPRAVGGLYGGCYYGKNSKYLYEDTNIPLIWLMGSKDKDTEPKNCIPMLEEIQKRGNVKLFWKVYDGATHCWNCIGQNGFKQTVRNTSGKSVQIVYIYSKKITEQSMKDSLEFFNSFE